MACQGMSAAQRNYQGYCDEEVDRLIAQQSQELDGKKRLALLARIQRKLEDAAARPVLALAVRLLRALAAREDPGAAPHAMQLRPHAGGLAGPERKQTLIDPLTRFRPGRIVAPDRS